MLLLGRSLLRAGGLLDVNNQFLLGLVLVDWAGWVVDLFVDVKTLALASAATVTEPV
jgi:hypothetical protein